MDGTKNGLPRCVGTSLNCMNVTLVHDDGDDNSHNNCRQCRGRAGPQLQSRYGEEGPLLAGKLLNLEVNV